MFIEKSRKRRIKTTKLKEEKKQPILNKSIIRTFDFFKKLCNAHKIRKVGANGYRANTMATARTLRVVNTKNQPDKKTTPQPLKPYIPLFFEEY